MSDTAFAFYESGGAERYLDVQHVETPADEWDEIRCSIGKVATSLSAGRTVARGADAGLGGGSFKLVDSSTRWASGGEVVQDCVFKGVFGGGKWRAETGSNVESYNVSNIKLQATGFTYPAGTNGSTVFARATVTLALPTYTVVAVDTVPPNMALVGKAATSPYHGTFPDTPLNPFTVPAAQATVNYPSGWMLQDIASEEVCENGGIWKKRYVYGYRFNFTP